VGGAGDLVMEVCGQAWRGEMAGVFMGSDRGPGLCGGGRCGHGGASGAGISAAYLSA